MSSIFKSFSVWWMSHDHAHTQCTFLNSTFILADIAKENYPIVLCFLGSCFSSTALRVCVKLC